MKKNFKCNTCNKETFITQFSFRGDGKHYDKYGRLLKCDCENKTELKFIQDPDKEFGVPNFGKFSSSSKEDKVKMLKQRSKEHFNKKIKGEKDYLDNKKETLNGNGI